MDNQYQDNTQYPVQEYSSISNPTQEIISNISNYVDELSRVSSESARIQAEGCFSSLFHMKRNIKANAYANEVNGKATQQTIQLIMLIMGGMGRMNVRINIIMKTINMYEKYHVHNVDVLNYLTSIKSIIKDYLPWYRKPAFVSIISFLAFAISLFVLFRSLNII